MDKLDRGVINTRMAIITFPHNKDLIALLREGKYKHLIHNKEGKEVNTSYIPRGMGTYTLFSKDKDTLSTSEEEQYESATRSEGCIQTMYFDDAKLRIRMA